MRGVRSYREFVSYIYDKVGKLYQKHTGDNNNYEEASFRFKCRIGWTNICV